MAYNCIYESLIIDQYDNVPTATQYLTTVLSVRVLELCFYSVNGNILLNKRWHINIIVEVVLLTLVVYFLITDVRM